ncbi:hypothetical protein [Oxalobacter formigenes]
MPELFLDFACAVGETTRLAENVASNENKTHGVKDAKKRLMKKAQRN